MKIQWINHAGYILHLDDHISLAVDPWLDGKCFNDGWELLVPNERGYEQIKQVTHIWFSHEHPDHFNPQNIAKIDAEIRRKITVLFQSTKDGKVVEFCRQKQFKNVIELPKKMPFSLSNSVILVNGPMQSGDSWLLIKTPSLSILNVNDCPVYSERRCQELHALTGDVDILMTQFANAQWIANPDQDSKRIESLEHRRRVIRNQINTFRPKFVFPFASFIRFCHEENSFCNSAHNRIDNVRRFISEELGKTVVCLLPNDEWDFESDPEILTNRAISRYVAALMEAEEGELGKIGQITSASDICKLSTNYFHKIRSKVGLVRWFYVRNKLPTIIIKLTDTNQLIKFGPKNQTPLKLEAARLLKPDIETASENIVYWLKYPWGAATLLINGRFQVRSDNGFENLMHYVRYSNCDNSGQTYPESLFTRYIFELFAEIKWRVRKKIYVRR